MKYIVVLFAAVACVSASLLGAAPLVPRVNVGPTQVNVVKQPVTIQQPVSVLRKVPYPVKAVAYTAPAVASPVIHAAPLVQAAYAAPVIAAPALAAPAVTAYAAAPAVPVARTIPVFPVIGAYRPPSYTHTLL